MATPAKLLSNGTPQAVSQERALVAAGSRSDSNVADMAHAIARRREQLLSAIATAAYYRAERRGFAPGHELEDWLAAQEEVLGQR